MQAGIYDRFLEAYVTALKAKGDVIGDPEKEGVEIGPVVDKAQFDRIMGIISSAKDKKDGTLIYGGRTLGDKVYTNNDQRVGSIMEANLGDRASTSNLLFLQIPQEALLYTKMKFSVQWSSSTYLMMRTKLLLARMIANTVSWAACSRKIYKER